MMIVPKGSHATSLMVVISFVIIFYDGLGLGRLQLLQTDSIQEQKGTNERTALVIEAGDDTSTTPTVTFTERKKCVIFAGPMKTGSSSLDTFVKKKLGNSALMEDNYVDYGDPAADVAKCTHDEKKDKPFCKEVFNDFKSFVSTNASKRNIFVGHERFAQDGVNVTELTSYLSPDYDIHVVLYYRRFYDWIHSLYNQRFKPKAGRDQKTILTFLEYLRVSMEREYRVEYAVTAYDKYNSSPDIHNVSIVNMHHDAANFDTVEAFACDQLRDAPHFCEAAKSRPPDKNSNPSVPLDWLMFRQRLSKHHPTEQLDDESWQRIEEKFQSMTDKPKVCLSDDIKDTLLQVSLFSETALTPESFYNSDEGLEALKSDFEEKVKTKFCDIDVETIAISHEWEEFFEGVETLSRN